MRNTRGYRNLIVWENAVKLRRLTYKLPRLEKAGFSPTSFQPLCHQLAGKLETFLCLHLRFEKAEFWQSGYRITQKFPRKEFRRISQMNDAARSVKQNIQEGYPKSTLEFTHALTVSQGSLQELHGDFDDCLDDGLITQEEFSLADELCGKTDYLFSKLIESLRRKNAT